MRKVLTLFRIALKIARYLGPLLICWPFCRLFYNPATKKTISKCNQSPVWHFYVEAYTAVV